MDERLPEPGWYPDPAGGSALRYWDGQRWASSSGDRRSAETGREDAGNATGYSDRDAATDATAPIDLNDPPPAPNRADPWESYSASGSFSRGPFRPLAVVVLLVVFAGAVVAFALGGDGDEPADAGAGAPAADEADEADEADAPGGAEDTADDPGEAAPPDDDQGGDGGQADDDGDQTDESDPANGGGSDDSASGDDPDGSDTADGPIVLDGRCELPRDQVGDVEVGELRAWDFDTCDLAPLDPDDGEQLIVITASLDGSTVSEAAARETAGERGLLWSSHYPALAPGFWVVFLGPFDDEEAAAGAAEEAGGGAYLRRLTG